MCDGRQRVVQVSLKSDDGCENALELSVTAALQAASESETCESNQATNASNTVVNSRFIANYQ
jgi:hypothetical protein